VAGINLDTEKVFRKVIFAAIKQDDKSFEELLETFASGQELLAADQRASDVALLIIAEQYKGRPTPEMVTRLADYVASMNEGWSGITAADFNAFIHAILEDTPLESVLPTGVAIRAPFILTAHLLIQFETTSEKAFDYLDRLWEVLETRN
jgi:hypothetical protein